MKLFLNLYSYVERCVVQFLTSKCTVYRFAPKKLSSTYIITMCFSVFSDDCVNGLACL